jgi:hypothetical protein
MRRVVVCEVVAVLTIGSWSSANAQQADDTWDVLVAPYVMGAAMSGATIVRGAEVDVDLSASDIFSNLQFGAMGVVVARKGDWGFGADLIWVALGTTVREINVDFNQGAFAFYGLRRLSPAADVTFGLRVNTLEGRLTFKPTNQPRSQDKTWVDPIVGLTLRSPGNRLLLGLYTEIGGFGAGSDFTWQAYPNLGITLTDTASLNFGYRWLGVDYSTGEGNEAFRYDVLTQGPVIGFGFRF